MNVTALRAMPAPYAATVNPGSTAPAVVKAEADGSYNSSTMVTLTYFAADSAEQKALYERTERHVSGPMLASDNSIRIIEDRLKKFQKNLSLARPDLAKSDWDVTVKDGKLKVSGDIDPDDKRYMEARLNGDQALVGAVETYMGAAVAYLEASDENPPYTAQNGDTGRTMLYNFKDVGKQLEGKISFKELIATSWAAYDNPHGGPPSDPGNYRGGQSLEILASRLTSTPLSEK